MGAEWHQGQMSAWLQKKKSGSAMVRVRQYNKRYFTIDFDARVFFYAHGENSKKVSIVIPFTDILDVRVPESQMVQGDNASTCSRQSRVSFMKRLSNPRLKDEEQEEHRVTLLTRPAKTMELICSSAEEAATWFEAFKAAIADSGGDDGTCGDRAVEHGTLFPLAAEAGGRSWMGDGAGEAAGRPAATPAAAAAVVGVEAATASPEEVQPPTPPARGTFLDFSVDPEPSGTAATESSNTGTRGVLCYAKDELEQQDVTVISAAPITSLQAADFGFGGDDEDSDSEASSAGGGHGGGNAGCVGAEAGAVALVDSSPDAALGDRNAGSGAFAAAHSSSAVGVASPAPAAGRSSYEDRNAGLTMQERLANLEFSDDEDDDDPLGLGTAKGGDG